MNKVLVILISSAHLLRATTLLRTTPVTTTPATPRGSCLYEGKFYADGETIYEDEYKCYGVFCEGGSPVHWDDKCNFYIPTCSGPTERVTGQCCPICHGTTLETTIPSTTIKQSSVPPGGCFHDGKTYTNGEKVTSDPNDCSGSVCSNGVMISYETQCHYPPNVCPGAWQTVPGECCEVCLVNQTTTEVPELWNTSCTMGDKNFTLEAKAVDDQGNPCKTCECMPDGIWSCVSVLCTDVSDCKVSYRPQGECCYTCSGVTLSISIRMVYILTALLSVKGLDFT